MTNVNQALTHGNTSLAQTSPSPRIDAEILLAFVLKTTRTALYTHPEWQVMPKQWQEYQMLIQQRHAGHPIAYLTGSKEFWSLPLQVSSDTLIPRPETELLVELTLTLLATAKQAKILELGTGSGAIALALARERPTWEIQAVDISEPALAIARKNAAALNLLQVQFSQSNWFAGIKPQFFDAIISNPPYIAENDPHLEEGDIRFEPRQALSSGQEGLNAISEILHSGINYLHSGGFLLIEHGCSQKNAVANCFKQTGYSDITHWSDWQGLDRVSGGFRK